MLALAQAANSLPLTSETLIPLGVSVACCVAILAAMSRLIGKANEVLTRIRIIEARLRRVWTINDQKVFELQMQRDNPTLRVPDSYQIGQDREDLRE